MESILMTAVKQLSTCTFKKLGVAEKTSHGWAWRD